MKALTIQEAKDEGAKSRGFDNFEDFEYNETRFSVIHDFYTEAFELREASIVEAIEEEFKFLEDVTDKYDKGVRDGYKKAIEIIKKK